MSTTFENARVGDKVWSVSYGHGVVCSVRHPPEYGGLYPLKVLFGTNPAVDASFTLLGQELSHQSQTLFWQEIKFEVPEQPPRMKLINGIEVPDISFRPDVNKRYYHPSLDVTLHYGSLFTRGDIMDEFRAGNSLCYPYTDEGKEAAILHAKALLCIC
jgi:hypothetical protein